MFGLIVGTWPFSDIPETKVKLGSSLDPSTIREGTDVYFDCLVLAHPHVYKVEWRHNVSILAFIIIINIIVIVSICVESNRTFKYISTIYNMHCDCHI